MRDIPAPSAAIERLIWRDGAAASGPRIVPEETPVALTYGRATHAVMMATPADLRDFALGFSLAEGIAGDPRDIETLDIISNDTGIELRMDLVPARQTGLERRRRHITGPGGCGLCGMDSLAEALRPVRQVMSNMTFSAGEVQAAAMALTAAQHLNAETRAVHAAGFWVPGRGLIAAREDVGRHNALDKLIGALAWAGEAASRGIVVLSSRVSVEMVQKTAILGAPAIVAVSAPTALAVRVAEAAGVTLIGVARQDGFEVFTHSNRITTGPVQHVA